MRIAASLKAYHNHHEDVERLLKTVNAFWHDLEQVDDWTIVYTFEDDSRLKVETLPTGDTVEEIK